MAAPVQTKRHISAPLSRSQRSGSWVATLMILATLGLLITGGGFLVFLSLQSGTRSVDDAKTIDAVTPETSLRNSEKEREAGSLLLTTEHGTIKINFRPDLSPESVAYVRELVETQACHRCNLYRAEKEGILQGVMGNPGLKVTVVKGKCPPEYQGKQQECPKHDPNCACHGPTMTRGMVGWAGGGTGPDFFMSTYHKPATHWGQQHTVWGEIQDEASFQLIDKIYELPTTRKGMTFLDKKLDFTLALE